MTLDLEAIKARCIELRRNVWNFGDTYEAIMRCISSMLMTDTSYKVKRLQSENARLRGWILVANTQRERGATGEALASIELYAQWIIKQQEQFDV